MAINQVSLFFYPPRWRQRLPPASGLQKWDGTSIQIADAVRDDSADGRAITRDEMNHWLAGQRFKVADWGYGRVFVRGRVRSMFGVEKEIQVNVTDEAAEVVELYCRFTLPRRKKPPLAEWAAFMASMCERFGLRLDSSRPQPCSKAEFIAAVLEDRNYQDFAAGSGWARPEGS